MTLNDRYRDVAASFNEYLKDFFAPADNHTTYYFGYKPVLDIIGETKGFPDISVFDYGSGAGQFCAYLNELGARVTGYEISEAMLETAKTNFPALSEDFLDIIPNDSENKYDICTMNFVTCELADEQEVDKVLFNAYRLLKPNGKLVILTNNPESNPIGANYNIWSVGPVNTQQEGSEINITIHTEETSFELKDYFWSEKFIRHKLKLTGFERVQSFSPKLKNSNEDIWKDELKYSPTLIYVAVKI